MLLDEPIEFKVIIDDQVPEVNVDVEEVLTILKEVISTPTVNIYLPDIFTLDINVENLGYSGSVTTYGSIRTSLYMSITTVGIHTSTGSREYGDGVYGDDVYGGDVYGGEEVYGAETYNDSLYGA